MKWAWKLLGILKLCILILALGISRRLGNPAPAFIVLIGLLVGNICGARFGLAYGRQKGLSVSGSLTMTALAGSAWWGPSLASQNRSLGLRANPKEEYSEL